MHWAVCVSVCARIHVTRNVSRRCLNGFLFGCANNVRCSGIRPSHFHHLFLSMQLFCSKSFILVITFSHYTLVSGQPASQQQWYHLLLIFTGFSFNWCALCVVFAFGVRAMAWIELNFPLDCCVQLYTVLTTVDCACHNNEHFTSFTFFVEHFLFWFIKNCDFSFHITCRCDVVLCHKGEPKNTKKKKNGNKVDFHFPLSHYGVQVGLLLPRTHTDRSTSKRHTDNIQAFVIYQFSHLSLI